MNFKSGDWVEIYKPYPCGCFSFMHKIPMIFGRMHENTAVRCHCHPDIYEITTTATMLSVEEHRACYLYMLRAIDPPSETESTEVERVMSDE